MSDNGRQTGTQQSSSEFSRRRNDVMQVQEVQGRCTWLSSVIIGVLTVVSVGVIALLSAGFLCVDERLCIIQPKQEVSGEGAAGNISAGDGRVEDEAGTTTTSAVPSSTHQTRAATISASTAPSKAQQSRVSDEGAAENISAGDGRVEDEDNFVLSGQEIDLHEALVLTSTEATTTSAALPSTHQTPAETTTTIAASSNTHQPRGEGAAGNISAGNGRVEDEAGTTTTSAVPSSTHQTRAATISASTAPSKAQQSRVSGEGAAGNISAGDGRIEDEAGTTTTSAVPSSTLQTRAETTTTIAASSNTHQPRGPKCGHRPISGRKGGHWPFLASLQVNGSHSCAATIVSRTFVLTAADCVRRRRRSATLSVVTGEENLKAASGHEKKVSVEKIFMDSDEKSADAVGVLALLEVKPAILMDAWRQPVCLPVAADGLKTNQDAGFPTDVCLALGWGGNETEHLDNLQATPLHLMNAERCSGTYGENVNLLNEICAVENGTSSCYGDGGGPLLGNRDDRFFLFGVTSKAHGPCPDSNSPSVFANVTAFMPWITTVVRDLPSDD